MLRLRGSTIMVVGMLASMPATADDTSIRTKFDAMFLQCTKPANVNCVGLSEESRTRCSECQEWGGLYTVTAGSNLSVAAYTNRQQAAPEFIRDVLTSMYNLSSEQAREYTPPHLPALYNDPERYGWREIATPRPGSITLDRSVILYAIDHLPPIEGRGPFTARSVFQRPFWSMATIFGWPRITDGPIALEDIPLLFRGERPITLLPKFEFDHVTPNADGSIPAGWNAWFEQRASSRTNAVSRLVPNMQYNLTVHVAPQAYRGQFSRAASGEVMARTWTMANSTAARTLRLTALALTDEDAMYVHGSGVADLYVDLDKIRAWSGEGPPEGRLPTPPERRNATYVFGETIIPVTTTEREGITFVGLSIWDEQSTPIDDIAIPICVAATEARARELCTAQQRSGVSFSSFDVGRPTAAAAPDAVLHFVSFGHSVTGIFRVNQRGAQFVSWRIPGGLRAFRGHLAELNDRFASAQYNTETFARTGEELYRLLFGLLGGHPDPATLKAQATFETFARSRIRRASGDVPTLFVRFLETEPERRLGIIPLGLAKMGPAPDAYLGYSFHIQTPLPQHGSSSPEKCVSDWTLVLPRMEHETLGTLRTKFDRDFRSWRENSRLFESMRDFRLWIGTNETTEASAIVILSHHDRDQETGTLSMDKHDDLRPAEIYRQFDGGAIAILNGCETAGPTVDNFLSRFNNHGVGTVIATFFAVESTMALDYLRCLSLELPEGNGGTTTLAAAHHRALRCLARTRPESGGNPYGPAALAYTLIGNPTARLCQPVRRAEPQTSGAARP
jgi:hypothetical protein